MYRHAAVDRFDFKAAWRNTSKEQRRDYRRALFLGRRAADPETSRLVVEVARRALERQRQTRSLYALAFAAGLVAGVWLWIAAGSSFLFLLNLGAVLLRVYLWAVAKRAVRLNEAWAAAPPKGDT